MTPLSLRTRRSDDGTVVLTATGELDLSNVGTFADALANAVSSSSTDGGVVTVDLREIEYLDSAAINTLYDHPDRIRLVANPILIPVLRISGLADVVPVEPATPMVDGV
jgi:anti-anti-sigma factor